MTRREIFFLVSLAIFSVYILIGAYLWNESCAFAKIRDGIYARQTEDLQKEEKDVIVPQDYSVKSLFIKPSQAAANTKAAGAYGAAGAGSAGTVQAAPGSVQRSSPAPVSPVSPSPVINVYSAMGAKVGDLVKLGDVEMIVIKSTAKHKVIDITLKGNDTGQPPRLVLSTNDRIVYEIDADVDVNMNVTEKTTIDKSPIFYGVQKAGK